mmetsp:Transcript_58157/g.67030  ORF Transcript_58157/g.67030 Transcript_58157/m.67030 type:complete len:486 (+) Transcript_58157:104-1561(+)
MCDASLYWDCTLSPKMVFRFGDQPFFESVLNNDLCNASLPLFVKYKSSATSYTWTRVRRVVDQHHSYVWNGKSFLVRLELENDVTIGFESVSSKAVDQDDVDAYVANSGGGALPSHDAIQKSKEKMISGIIRRKLTDEDKAAMVSYAQRLSKFASNVAVQHTLTMLENMRSETEAGVRSSFHECGYSTRAQERRLADVAASSQQLLSSSSPHLTSPLTQMTEDGGRGGSTWVGQATQEAMSPFSQATAPSTPVEVCEKLTESAHLRWTAAVAAEETFYSYASQPDRIAFSSRLASKTNENRNLNAIASLKAIGDVADSKKSSNMVESSGLWITDDSERHKIASDHRSKQEGGAAAATKTTEVKKAATTTPTANAEASARTPVTPTNRPAVLLSQEFNESVPDTLFDDMTALASEVSSEPSTPQMSHVIGTTFQKRSPSMLQLQSIYASMTSRPNNHDSGASAVMSVTEDCPEILVPSRKRNRVGD